MNPRQFIDDIKHWEGSVPWLYLDVRGFPTVGVGNLLPNASAAMALPFVMRFGVDTKPAFSHEINADYARVSRMAMGLPARSYRVPSSPILLAEDIDALLTKRLTDEFLPGLEKLFHGFASFPEPAQSALVDLVFNLGVGGLGKFHRLADAVERRNWSACAAECNRRTSRDERNKWTREKFTAAEVPTA